MATGQRDFLGTGWKFPIRPNPRGELTYSSGEQDIQEAIWIVLSTAPGERQMRPLFGCGIYDFVFAPNNPTTRGSIAHQVHEALTRWEPRIDVLDVRVESSPEGENLILIRIDYRIRSNNAMHNIVYPFYIQESGGS
jgi:phage baseplate assembly protein W